MSSFLTFLLLNDICFKNWSPRLNFQASVQDFYISISTRRKNSSSRAHFVTSKLFLYFGFIWFMTSFRLWAPQMRPWSSNQLFQCLIPGGGGGLRIWKGWGCSSEILNQTLKGDQSRRGPSFFCPLKDTMSRHRLIIYVFVFFPVQH